MQPNRYMILATDTILFAISNFGSKILTLLLVPLYTNILTTAEFGISDLITTTVNLIYPLLTLAISEAVLRYAFEKDYDSRQVVSNALLLVVASTVVLAIVKPIVELFTSVLSAFWWYFVAIYFLSNIHLCFSNYTKAVGKTKLFAIQGIIQTAVLVVCNILFLLVFHYGIHGYLISIIAGYVVAVLLMVIGGRYGSLLVHPSFDKKVLSEMVVYSGPMIPNILAWWINTSVNKYMIIAMLGMGASGVYSVAQKIPTIITTVTSLFNQAWLLSAIKSYGAEDESDFYTKVYGAFYMVTMLMGIFLIPLSKPIAHLLFAKDFFEAWKYAPYLLISAIFAGSAGFLASAFRAAKNTKALMNSAFLGAAVNIVLSFILIKAFGAIGAAFATMISFAVILIRRILDIKKIIKINVRWSRVAASYVLIIVAATLIIIEIKYAYVFYVLLAGTTVLINIRELISYATLTARLGKKMIHDKLKIREVKAND